MAGDGRRWQVMAVYDSNSRWQNRTEQNITELNRSEQNRTEQNRIATDRNACLLLLHEGRHGEEVLDCRDDVVGVVGVMAGDGRRWQEMAGDGRRCNSNNSHR
jgi:hypothetical protein